MVYYTKEELINIGKKNGSRTADTDKECMVFCPLSAVRGALNGKYFIHFNKNKTLGSARVSGQGTAATDKKGVFCPFPLPAVLDPLTSWQSLV